MTLWTVCERLIGRAEALVEELDVIASSHTGQLSKALGLGARIFCLSTAAVGLGLVQLAMTSLCRWVEGR